MSMTAPFLIFSVQEAIKKMVPKPAPFFSLFTFERHPDSAGCLFLFTQNQARSMYSPVRVSTRIISPVLMNSGTCRL